MGSWDRSFRFKKKHICNYDLTIKKDLTTCFLFLLFDRLLLLLLLLLLLFAFRNSSTTRQTSAQVQLPVFKAFCIMRKFVRGIHLLELFQSSGRATGTPGQNIRNEMRVGQHDSSRNRILFECRLVPRSYRRVGIRHFICCVVSRGDSFNIRQIYTTSYFKSALTLVR